MEYIDPEPPPRTWVYVARDGEVIGKIIRKHYERRYGREAVTQIMPVILALQPPDRRDQSARLRGLTVICLRFTLRQTTRSLKPLPRVQVLERTAGGLSRLAGSCSELKATSKLKKDSCCAAPAGGQTRSVRQAAGLGDRSPAAITRRRSVTGSMCRCTG